MATYLLATGARHALKCVYACKIAAYYNIPNRASCKALRPMKVILSLRFPPETGVPQGPRGGLQGAYWGPGDPMPQGLLGCPLEPRGSWGAPGAPGALDPSVALEAWRRSGPYGGAL